MGSSGPSRHAPAADAARIRRNDLVRTMFQGPGIGYSCGLFSTIVLSRANEVALEVWPPGTLETAYLVKSS